jgi:hypothetical protein
MPDDRYGYATDSVYAEVDRLVNLGNAKRPLYDDRFVTTPAITAAELADADAYDRAVRRPNSDGPADPAALTQTNAPEIIRMVADHHRVPFSQVRDMAIRAHERAELGFSEPERVRVLSEVSIALSRRRPELSDEQVLELSRRVSSDDEVAELTARHDDILGLAVSSDMRDRLAKTGHALPDGHFPCHDAKHVGLAKAAYKAGKLAGHSKSEVKAHINKHAKRLGLPGLDDDGDDDVAATTIGLTQETAGMQLSAAGQDSADAVVARHPELAHLFRR